MNPTIKNYQYIKELGGVLTRSFYKYGGHDLIDFDNCLIYIFRRDEYTKRNNKTCYIDQKGEWVKFDKSLIRYSSQVSHNPNSPTHEDWAIYNRRTVKYLKNSDIKEIIKNYEDIQYKRNSKTS